ncbi:VCBS domain-containing protein [Vibrio japonicus]|uniref:VCBS domain-containing protein n=1 Tax=Vibrio japonicus TaxID=1824638 RepID=A0ABY5LBL8_9VIBR|nr:VCBS domain-containing protein [Vibrio japonicus]UUM29447.1 VCBS domain-containing protein [Vibrio japonicus]
MRRGGDHRDGHLARKRRGQHRQRVPGASRCGGQYGTFRVDANGKWTYVLDNGNETAMR